LGYLIVFAVIFKINRNYGKVAEVMNYGTKIVYFFLIPKIFGIMAAVSLEVVRNVGGGLFLFGCVVAALYELVELDIVICETFSEYNTTWNQSEVVPCFPLLHLLWLLFYLLPFFLLKSYVLIKYRTTYSTSYFKKIEKLWTKTANFFLIPKIFGIMATTLLFMAMDDEEDDEAIGGGLVVGVCMFAVLLLLYGIYRLDVVVCETFLEYNTTWNQSETAMHEMPCFPFVTMLNIGFVVMIVLLPLMLWKRHVLFK